MSRSSSEQMAQGIPTNTSGQGAPMKTVSTKTTQTTKTAQAGQPEQTTTTTMAVEQKESTPPGCGGDSMAINFVMIGAMIVLFYFFLIRPQKKRQTEHTKMLNSLVKGDKVITSGGIVGKIVSISNGRVSLRVGAKNTITVLRSHVSGVDRSDEKKSKKDENNKSDKEK